MSLTAHVLVKNEEFVISYAIESVIAYVDVVLVYDTGSTDNTIGVITSLQQQYPNKIIVEQKGEADHVRHTQLRNEMIAATTTDWFMILDGDEVWSTEAMDEAMQYIQEEAELVCMIAPFYLCVGDIYHTSTRGMYTIRGKTVHATPRLFKHMPGMHWDGSYDADILVTEDGVPLSEQETGVRFLQHRFWHLSHLVRSPKDDDTYSSGNRTRAQKRVLTYHVPSKKIGDPVPDVFTRKQDSISQQLSFVGSLTGFVSYVSMRIRNRYA